MRRLIAILVLMTAMPLMAAPQPSALTQHWQPHNENSTLEINHAALTAFLQKYLVVRDDGPNLLHYGQVTTADHRKLQAYIDSLTRISLGQYNRDQQLAYWINLYNAALIDLVLDHYPVSKVTTIGGSAASPWTMPVVTADGMQLSLDEIKNQILQPIWQEPIIAYGLSYAAIGGPELPASAYQGQNIYVQLRNSAKRFVNSPQGATITDSRLIISRFFDWHRDIFGDDAISLISQLRAHAQPRLSARLDIFDKIAGYRFNWHLNDAD